MATWTGHRLRSPSLVIRLRRPDVSLAPLSARLDRAAAAQLKWNLKFQRDPRASSLIFLYETH